MNRIKTQKEPESQIEKIYNKLKCHLLVNMFSSS